MFKSCVWAQPQRTKAGWENKSRCLRSNHYMICQGSSIKDCSKWGGLNNFLVPNPPDPDQFSFSGPLSPPLHISDPDPLPLFWECGLKHLVWNLGTRLLPYFDIADPHRVGSNKTFRSLRNWSPQSYVQYLVSILFVFLQIVSWYNLLYVSSLSLNQIHGPSSYL